MTPRVLAITVPATYEDAALVRALLPVFVRGLPFTRTAVLRLEICLAEALHNVVRHSYAETDGDVEVVLRALPDRLVIEVADRGAPMPEAARRSIRAGAPVRDPRTTPVPELPERGFGIPILRAVLDDVAYRSEGGRNVLTMTKRHVVSRATAPAG